MSKPPAMQVDSLHLVFLPRALLYRVISVLLKRAFRLQSKNMLVHREDLASLA